MYRLCEPTLQAWVGIDEVVHLIRVACHNTDELSTIVFQTLQQGINSLGAKGIAIVRLQGISLIDKQHATDSLIHQLIRLDGRLSGIACHQFSTVGLHQLSTGYNTECLEDIGHNSGHSGLTCTRITREDIVLTLEGIGLSTLDLQVEEGSQVGNLLLDGTKSH